MATPEIHDYVEDVELDSGSYDSDDSSEDPTVDVLEEAQYSFSKLSVKKKSKPRVHKETEETAEEDPDVISISLPELDQKDRKCYEVIQKVVEDGQLEKLKVEQCKVYLRKHGLRLTGSKDTLIQRIKEYLDIVNGGGETKYPASSFVLNCKGDACMGDVVLFEQNVYEIFNIASRSANGPPCGTRVVAGRIIKESYGAAKQQHTFTVEVLWSKGEKPLPPLYPLLVKGRNLYRLKTMRQKWEDEGERQKILLEKHTRGSTARLNRKVRIQKMEVRKMQKEHARISSLKVQNKIPTNNVQNPQSLSMNSEETLEQQTNVQNFREQTFQKEQCYPVTCNESARVLAETMQKVPTFSQNANIPSERIHQRQPWTSVTYGFQQNINSNSSRSPFRRPSYEGLGFKHSNRPLQKGMNLSSLSKVDSGTSRSWNGRRDHPVKGPGYEKKQLCRYYAQGRCYYGENCYFLHENRK